MQKREYWRLITMAAIMSGRHTVATATAAADGLLAEYERRAAEWDKEEQQGDRTF